MHVLEQQTSRITRLRMAAAATAGAVGAAIWVDVTSGAWRTAGALTFSALASVAIAVSLKAGVPRTRLSVEYVALAITSVFGAVLVLESTAPGLDAWRYTAAALTATAANWYVIASSLFEPPRAG